MNSAVISLRNIEFAIEEKYASSTILKNISIDLCSREFVALVGASGSGKTSLLNIMGLIERPTRGVVNFRGQDISQSSEADIALIRRHDVGFIFQDFQLIEVLTVAENVEYFLIRKGVEPKVRKASVDLALHAVGMYEHRNKRPAQLSGGQKQRTAIARAVAKMPKLIVADEPTANLDSANGQRVIELLQGLKKNFEAGIIIATHDMSIASHTDRSIKMSDGKIVAVDAPSAGVNHVA